MVFLVIFGCGILLGISVSKVFVREEARRSRGEGERTECGGDEREQKRDWGKEDVGRR